MKATTTGRRTERHPATSNRGPRRRRSNEGRLRQALEQRLREIESTHWTTRHGRLEARAIAAELRTLLGGAR